MIVSEEKKCVFIHVPKTGGSSITEILAPYVDPQASTEEQFGWQISFHKKGTRMHGALRGTFPDYFKFGFVRNPYDRVMSWWRDRGPYAIRHPLQPMWQLTLGLDYIARYERYGEEVRRICAQLDIPLAGELPHQLNRKKDIRPITEIEADAIYATYKKDFVRFGYDPASWSSFT